MKIAVTYENEEVFGHFGHTRQFKLYQVEDGKIISSEIIDTNGSGHGALAGLLKGLGADVLICGGIGQGARLALEEAGIRLFGGVFGSADKAVNDYIEGSQKREIRNYYQSVMVSDFFCFSVTCHDALLLVASCKITARISFL